jgi:hypothetical protein
MTKNAKSVKSVENARGAKTIACASPACDANSAIVWTSDFGLLGRLIGAKSFLGVGLGHFPAVVGCERQK